jgi:hypothetical protein
MCVYERKETGEGYDRRMLMQIHLHLADNRVVVAFDITLIITLSSYNFTLLRVHFRTCS